MIVLVVSLSIEALVAVFQFNHEQPAHLPYAATIVGAAAPRRMGAVYSLEPERRGVSCMEQAQREDERVP